MAALKREKEALERWDEVNEMLKWKPPPLNKLAFDSPVYPPSPLTNTSPPPLLTTTPPPPPLITTLPNKLTSVSPAPPTSPPPPSPTMLSR